MTQHPRLLLECEVRGVNPVIPLRGAKGKQMVVLITTGG